MDQTRIDKVMAENVNCVTEFLRHPILKQFSKYLRYSLTTFLDFNCCLSPHLIFLIFMRFDQTLRRRLDLTLSFSEHLYMAQTDENWLQEVVKGLAYPFINVTHCKHPKPTMAWPMVGFGVGPPKRTPGITLGQVASPRQVSGTSTRHLTFRTKNRMTSRGPRVIRPEAGVVNWRTRKSILRPPKQRRWSQLTLKLMILKIVNY